MTNVNFYENLIFKAIASAIGVNLASLRWFSGILPVPENDSMLFKLFDIVPDGGPMFDINNKLPSFSCTYGKLLQSQPQPDSFVVQIAKNNFTNTSYWLPPDIPVYTPSSADIVASVNNGALFDFELDSSNYPQPANIFYPSFPSFVVNQPFMLFNQMAEANQFIFKLHFDRIALVPVRAGGWFSQAAFTQAFQSGGKNWITGPDTVTWEYLFGDNGILKYICNGTLAVSGMVIEIQSFGEYDNTMLNALKDNESTAIWPFYLSGDNLIQNYVLGTDKSIKITCKFPLTEVLQLAIGVANSNNCLAGK